MRSMTGFGFAEQTDESAYVSVELKSYNNRFLDLVINLPPSLSSLEIQLREYLSERLTRGRVEVYVKVRDLGQALEVRLDESAVRSYVAALERLRTLAGITAPFTLSDLLAIEGILSVDRVRSSEEYWRLIEPMLTRAFKEFDAARMAEGAATKKDIEQQLRRIDQGVANIEALAPQYEVTIRESVRSRFAEVVGDEVDLNRVYTETAALLVRYSINEEVVRMRSHLASFREVLGTARPVPTPNATARPATAPSSSSRASSASSESSSSQAPPASISAADSSGTGVGKKLDFICQELNREINTAGSKSTMVEINRMGIEIKDAIENIREQLRNVE